MEVNIFHLIPSLIIIVISAIFCISSLKLGLGRFNDPGPGLIPFWVGCFLVFLSLGVIIETYIWDKSRTKIRLFEKGRRKVVLEVLLSFIGYYMVLNILGFILSTFLFLIFLFKISGGETWKVALIESAITIIGTYCLFVYAVGITFPVGFLGF
jgi:putative tricarboxylic transport membrane protein